MAIPGIVSYNVARSRPPREHGVPRRWSPPSSEPLSPDRRSSPMRHMLHRLLAVALCLAALSRPAHAQNTVVLEGTVKGPAGPLGGAQVTVVNSETQETARTTTRPSGEFRLLGLFPGQYAVTVRSI